MLMSVVIGIDPHKASHMAVAIDGDEQSFGVLEVVADRGQTPRLLAWAELLSTERTWAIESAGGLGKLLSQELVAAGEHVVDVPPTLSARVRLLGSSKTTKNDRHDALSTARSRKREVVVGEHVAPAAVGALVEKLGGSARPCHRHRIVGTTRFLTHRIESDRRDERGPRFLLDVQTAELGEASHLGLGIGLEVAVVNEQHVG
jgi:Transposase